MRKRGSSLLETAMFMPVLLVLMVGMVEIARVTYTYYTLSKLMLTVASYLGAQQGVNFCDDADAAVTAAKNLALTGTTDGSGETLIQGLTADQIQVRVERYTAETANLGQCDCAAPGCDTANGGSAPDFIVVSIPDGYSFRISIPQLPTDPILLKPRVRVPFQGT